MGSRVRLPVAARTISPSRHVSKFFRPSTDHTGGAADPSGRGGVATSFFGPTHQWLPPLHSHQIWAHWPSGEGATFLPIGTRLRSLVRPQHGSTRNTFYISCTPFNTLSERPHTYLFLHKPAQPHSYDADPAMIRRSVCPAACAPVAVATAWRPARPSRQASIRKCPVCHLTMTRDRKSVV